MSRVSSTPMFFGPVERRLFGWVHRAVLDLDHRLGVVVCPPFGQEAMNTHRTNKHFANSMAAIGIPALRFDYDGCGNSAGEDRDPDRLSAWISSVHSAIETLKGIAGVDSVLVVGIRFGATLAVLAARSRTDVIGVAAIAPVTNGRALVREWKAMGLVRGWRRRNGETGAAEAAPEPSDGAVEAAGFVMTAQTCESVGKINLLDAIDLRCRVLLIDRDDVSGSKPWQEALESAGVRVAREVLPGYLAMMSDPAYAKIPGEMTEALLNWARQCIGDQPDRSQELGVNSTEITASSSAVFAPGVEGGGVPVVETIIVRDDNGLQFGILSEPDSSSGSGSMSPTLPTLLLINSGAVHNIGPNRLYVPLARHFASHGFRVLRIDISGLGESEPHVGEPEVAPYTSLAVHDVEQWLAYLKERHLADECHLLGICSGAYHTYRCAVARVPLASALTVNPVTFYWTEGMSLDLPLPDHQVVRIAASYRKSLADPRKWQKVLGGRADLGLAARVTRRRAAAWGQRWIRGIGRLLQIPLKNDLSRDLQVASDHATRLDFIFSEGDPGHSILHEQGGGMVDRLRRMGKLSIRTIPGADHTFSSEAARLELKLVLAERLMGKNPAAESAP